MWAAFFVGGMEEGITLEYMLARDLLPRSTIFCIAGPGGAAAGFSSVGDLPESLAESLRDLATSSIQPSFDARHSRLVAERAGVRLARRLVAFLIGLLDKLNRIAR